jgi:hypothetical protein
MDTIPKYFYVISLLLIMLTFVIKLQFSYMSGINKKLQFDEGMDTTRLVEALW